MNIQEENTKKRGKTRAGRRRWKKDYFCLSIFLTPALRSLSIQRRSINPRDLSTTFSLVDHPIILDGVDKTRNRRIARGERLYYDAILQPNGEGAFKERAD